MGVGRSAGAWCATLDGAAAVVNLTGKSVNCRYTPKSRREIIESRVDSVRALEEACKLCKRPPPVWVQASSLAIYGDTGDRWCTEEAPVSPGFTGEVCGQWEKALNDADTPHTRKVILRIGLALGVREGTNNGLYGTLARLVKAYLGGAVGTGCQYVSWLHVDDLNRIVLEAIEDETVHGVYNATSPNPVTNAELMRELRRSLGRPWSPPVPAVFARLGAWLMRTEASLALTGRRCTPERLLKHGFAFQYPALRPTLEEIAHQNTTTRRKP